MSEANLDLNVLRGGSSACFAEDGRRVAGPEEERRRRLKDHAGGPFEAATYKLSAGGMTLADVDHMAVNGDPGANLFWRRFFSQEPSKLQRVRDDGHPARSESEGFPIG